MKIKTKYWEYSIFLIGMLMMVNISCIKENDNGNEIYIYYDSTGTVIDVEGNEYRTIKVDTQWWMAENLTTTKYRNGDPIPNITEDTAWSNLASGAYCKYDNSTTISPIYAKLYNFYAVCDPRGLAPEGWHVPSDGEWITLIDYLGGEDVAGGKMKIMGSIADFGCCWSHPNTGATNSSGFSAIPCGERINNGSFANLHAFALWWTTTPENIEETVHHSRYVVNDETIIFTGHPSMNWGLSVRCIKD